MPTRKKASKKNAVTSRTRRLSSGNGLNAFSMHAGNESGAAMISAVGSEIGEHQLSFAGGPNMTALDPETAAQRYLQQSLASNAVRGFTVPKSVAETTDFKSLGTEAIPLTGTVTVKFRQRLNKIPIYGSLVTVELGKDNSLIGMNSAIGEPTGVSSVAKVSPADATATVMKYGNSKKDLTNIVPRVYFYYDQGIAKWRLVYILEDVPVTLPKGNPE